MEIAATILFIPLIILSLLGKRWAYITTIILGVLFFLFRVGFQLEPSACLILFDIPLAIHSLTNYKHIILFGIFFIMTRRQIHKTGSVGFGWAALGTLAFGLVVELLEGVTGEGNCRMRDLIPDSAGVLAGQLVYFMWSYISSLFSFKSKSI